MLTNNQQLFELQLNEVIHHFPQLKRISGSDGDFLKGILDIPNDDGEMIGSFMIEVRNSKGFPYSFPNLYETGGDILNEANWHKYESGRCCITVEADEFLICRNGITILEFIKKHAIPYFANHLYRLNEGKYKNGEYAHNFDGNSQFYTSLFKTSDKNKWIEYYNHVFKKKTINIGRNDTCFCGSGQKFKFCHEKTFRDLKWLGKEKVTKQLLEIFKFTK